MVSTPPDCRSDHYVRKLLTRSSEQREQAGLARPGTSSSSGKLRVPGTPLRTPSTPNLAEFMDNGASSKETLAELWSNFLEQEAEAGDRNTSRRGSHPGPAKP